MVDGVVHIKFNESMQVPSNLSHYNSSSMDLYLNVSAERRLEEGFNASDLNFTWTVTNFTESGMTIQLKFKRPLLVSPKTEQDKLVIYFRTIKLFSA